MAPRANAERVLSVFLLNNSASTLSLVAADLSTGIWLEPPPELVPAWSLCVLRCCSVGHLLRIGGSCAYEVAALPGDHVRGLCVYICLCLCARAYVCVGESSCLLLACLPAWQPTPQNDIWQCAARSARGAHADCRAVRRVWVRICLLPSTDG